MKKIIFSAAAFGLVAVSSMALVPTTAEAIPAFARQTGAACLSCHFQTFPAINSFGRAFKMGSFTDVGDQALVEDEHLSIPAVLNASVVIRGDITNTKVTGTAGSTAYNIPSETPILIAGRIGSNTGAFVEFANGGAGAGITAAAATTGIAVGSGSAVTVGNWQLLNSFDMGDFKVGFGAHNSGFGGSGIMEVSNVFGQHGGKNNGKALSAIQSLGFTQQTLAVGGWIGSDLGIMQVSLVAPAAAQGTNVGAKFGKLFRGVATLDVAGFDTLIGFGIVTGKAGKAAANGGVGPIPMNLQFVDVQMQGDLGDMTLGIYADWAHAKGETDGVSGIGNTYGFGNTGAGAKSDAFSIRADLKPLHNVILGIGYGYSKNTGGTAVAPTQDIVNKNFLMAVTYEFYQNFEIILRYETNKQNISALGLLPATSVSTKTTTLEFEALM